MSAENLAHCAHPFCRHNVAGLVKPSPGRLKIAVAVSEKSATRIGLAAASPELSCTKRTECPILTIAVMKGNLKRSPKAPAKSKGGLPGRSNKGARGHFDPGAGNREDVRQQTRRVNVPRHSQRPTERSSQRRSRRP
jgi:hypothetical protein